MQTTGRKGESSQRAEMAALVRVGTGTRRAIRQRIAAENIARMNGNEIKGFSMPRRAKATAFHDARMQGSSLALVISRCRGSVHESNFTGFVSDNAI